MPQIIYCLRLSIEFVIQKIKLGTLTAGKVETTIGRFVASDNVFPYMS